MAYGAINDIASVNVIVSSWRWLYICKKPINNTKYVNNGVMPLTDESAALNTAVANSGVIELDINIGTNTGDNIAHFVDATGTNIDDIIITIKLIIIKRIPVNSKLLIASVREAIIKIPILLFLNIDINCA